MRSDHLDPTRFSEFQNQSDASGAWKAASNDATRSPTDVPYPRQVLTESGP